MESIEQLLENSNWFSQKLKLGNRPEWNWLNKGYELFALDIIIKDEPGYGSLLESSTASTKLHNKIVAEL